MVETARFDGMNLVVDTNDSVIELCGDCHGNAVFSDVAPK